MNAVEVLIVLKFYWIILILLVEAFIKESN